MIILFFFSDGFSLERQSEAVPSHVETLTKRALSTGRNKKEFLDDVFSELRNKEGLRNKYFQDSNALYADLALLAVDSDERVSEATLNIISLMALAHWASSMDALSGSSLATQSATPAINDISQSIEIKNALEQLIKSPDSNDEVKGRAIEAHSLLYPPQPDINIEFEKLIIEGGDRNGDTIAAIFLAFKNYKSMYNYEIPTSVLEAAKTLIDHPSEPVKTSALYTLRENVGKPILPLLFYELESTRSMGIANAVVKNILALDHSEDTVLKLKEIALKDTTRDKPTIIEYYINSKNIEHLRSLDK